MADKSVPSTGNTGPRDFSAEVGAHFAGRVPSLEAGRAALLRRVGNLLRSDWSMTYFDGRDCKRWINTALDGDADALRDLAEELASQEED